MSRQEHAFPHDRLDAYNVGLELVAQAKGLAARVPRGHRTLADQIMRAAGRPQDLADVDALERASTQ